MFASRRGGQLALAGAEDSKQTTLRALKSSEVESPCGFSNSTLMRGIVKALTEQGFISQALAEG